MFDFVVSYSTLKFLMPLYVQRRWQRKGLDVNTAFPNADLDEGINEQQPQVFMNSESEDCVYFLRKALYGLKQSSKQ